MVFGEKKRKSIHWVHAIKSPPTAYIMLKQMLLPRKQESIIVPSMATVMLDQIQLIDKYLYASFVKLQVENTFKESMLLTINLLIASSSAVSVSNTKHFTAKINVHAR